MSDNIEALATKPDELKASVEKLKRALPDLVEHGALVAEIKHRYFKSLVQQGFTEQQALVICMQSMSI